MIDFSTPLGKRAAEHLAADLCVWLTTVSSNGTPQPAPVWFLWEGGTVLIYTQPGAIKVRNIRSNPYVSLNFNCSFDGSDVVVISGVAEIDDLALDVAGGQLDLVAEFLCLFLLEAYEYLCRKVVPEGIPDCCNAHQEGFPSSRSRQPGREGRP